MLALDGVVDTPDAALGYFESAAWAGEAEAWRAAAILLDQGREVLPDPKRAARMLLRGAAEDDGSVVRMLVELAKGWSPATLRSVQARLRDAGLYTAAIDGVPGPAFEAALEGWRNGGFDPVVLEN